MSKSEAPELVCWPTSLPDWDEGRFTSLGPSREVSVGQRRSWKRRMEMRGSVKVGAIASSYWDLSPTVNIETVDEKPSGKYWLDIMMEVRNFAPYVVKSLIRR